MKIIDAHLHLSNIASFADTARLQSNVDYSVGGLLAECADNDVCCAIGMGVSETQAYGFPDNCAETPMLCDTAPLLYSCAGINPFCLHGQALTQLEAELQKPHNVGIKIYAGYYPVHLTDKIYDPVYAIAKKYNKAICIHTGDTYSERGLLEYSHPFNVDRLAVVHREISFILAHMGDPWLMDACELAYKNTNVYLDTSGLVVGEEQEVLRVKDEPLLRDRFRQAILFLNNYDKLIFGTDWPLIAMRPYIDLCKTLVDKHYHKKYFYDNAARVYKIML